MTETDSPQKPRVVAFLQALACLALVAGCFLRFAHLDRKIFWNDETYTALRVSGYNQTDLANLFDGKVRTIAEIRRLQHLSPAHGVGDTVRSLIADDPQHPPLFYAAERLWAGIAGDEPARLRLLAALFSLLALPAIYLLSVELFASRLGGLIAAALVAISPFHLIYAHEAREYSFWAFSTLAVSYALLRALRLRTVSAWALYGGLLALGLYGALLTVYTIAAHALFVALAHRKSRASLLGFAAAVAGALVAFGPWIYVMLARWHTMTSYMSWGNFHYPLPKMAQKWAFNFGAVLFDAEFANLRLLPVALFFMLALLFAIGYTLRYAERRSVLFVALLGVVTAGIFVVQDFRSGTYFSTIARYLTPLWLTLELCLAFTIADAARRRDGRVRIAAGAIFAAAVCAGTASSAYDGTTEAWWNNNTNGAARKLSAVVNHADRPLLVSTYKPDTILVISHELDPSTHILLVPAVVPRDLPTGFGTYILLSPSPAQETQATFSDRFAIGRREYFDDAQSPIEQFHADLRKQQAAIGAKARETPQDFLIFLTERKAQSDEMFYHKKNKARLA